MSDGTSGGGPPEDRVWRVPLRPEEPGDGARLLGMTDWVPMPGEKPAASQAPEDPQAPGDPESPGEPHLPGETVWHVPLPGQPPAEEMVWQVPLPVTTEEAAVAEPEEPAPAPAGAAAASPAAGAASPAAGVATAAGTSSPATGAASPAAGAAPPGMALPAGWAEAPDEGAKRPAVWARFLAGSVVIVVAMATATAISLLLYLSDIAEGLADAGVLRGVQSRLDRVEGDDQQTFLVLGSDQRAGPQRDKGRSDTTMLLRVDPNDAAIRLLSLPRDLRVNIDGRGVDKLNQAYTIGGPKLTLDTVKKLTGLQINHVVNIDFNGFAKAIDAIDCVYVDVDRKYFNSNEGRAAENQFAEIDINPGYRRLCGLDALAYVRFRHDDNDLVRAARQQDFLREARQKVPLSEFTLDPRGELVEIFTEHTDSDIDDTSTLLEAAKTLFEARNAPVEQIHFQGDIGGPDDPYVTASKPEIREAVRQFEGIEPAPGSGGDGDEGSGRKRKQKQKAKKKEKESEQGDGDGSDADLDDVGDSLLEPGVPRFANTSARRLKLPVYYPKGVVPGSIFDSASRQYEIIDTDGNRREAYKLVLSIPPGVGPAPVTEYYGVMGTEWDDPPILENPTDTVTIDGREFQRFFDGDRLRLVSWRTKRGTYWISNTLLQSLSEEQMLAIAASVKRVKE